MSLFNEHLTKQLKSLVTDGVEYYDNKITKQSIFNLWNFMQVFQQIVQCLINDIYSLAAYIDTSWRNIQNPEKRKH